MSQHEARKVATSPSDSKVETTIGSRIKSRECQSSTRKSETFAELSTTLQLCFLSPHSMMLASRFGMLAVNFHVSIQLTNGRFLVIYLLRSFLSDWFSVSLGNMVRKKCHEPSFIDF